MSGGALSLLRGNGAFRALWFSRSTCYLGDSLSLVALMLYVADTTGQAMAVAVLLLVGDFAPSLLAPFAGTISDRFELRRVMIVCELAQAGLVAAMVFALPSLPWLLVLVAARAVVGQVFAPASRSAMPAVVPARDLGTANSVLGLGTNGAEILGPLLAAVLLPVAGVQWVLALDAATFLLSAAVLALLPRIRADRAADDGTRASFWADSWAGVGWILKTPAVRTVVIAFCAVVAFNGVDDVALVFLATDTLGAGAGAVGIVLAGAGIGLLAGYALLARLAGRLPMAVLFAAGLAISSAGNLLTGVAWAVAVVLALQTARGLGIAAMDVGANTLLQRMVPEAMLGRVFGNLYGAIGVAAAASYVLGGVLLDATSPPVTFMVAGAGGLVAAAGAAWALRRH